MLVANWPSSGGVEIGPNLVASFHWGGLAVPEQVAAAGLKQLMRGRQRAGGFVPGFAAAVGLQHRGQAVEDRAGMRRRLLQFTFLTDLQ